VECQEIARWRMRIEFNQQLIYDLIPPHSPKV
jgi:hypothetical protein